MACFHPLRAIQFPGGNIQIFNKAESLYLKPTPAGLGRDLKLPCGRCIGCRLQRSQDWATRCLHESQLYEDNCFLTLTYDPNYRPQEKNRRLVSSTSRHVDEPEIRRELSTIASEGLDGPNNAHVGNSRQRTRSAPASKAEDRSASCLTPEGGGERGLSIRDHTKFTKRLRKKCGPLRFYMCGEYGKNLAHPHYHYLIFGYNFPDRYHWKTSKSGEKIFRSAMLDEIWPFGHAWIGTVTYESCAYVAAYVMKKITGEKAWDHYQRTDEAGCNYWLTPEFNLMSRGGHNGRGIAADWWKKFNADVYTQDVVVREGRKMRPPRYYDKLLELFDPAAMAVIKMHREHRVQDFDADNTPARLEVKEKVTKARLSFKKRQLENDQ